jgi:hypothetical protein
MESIEALAEKLDRVELPPQAELKTYHVVGSNLDAISRTLNGMATRGVLSGTAQPGKPQVQVMIETEPKSSTLIVAGDATTFERVEAMLKDLSAVPVEKGLRIFPVANLRAEDVKVKSAGDLQRPGLADPGRQRGRNHGRCQEQPADGRRRWRGHAALRQGHG